MKILHVISGLSDGGAEAMLSQLCALDKDNRHVVISMTDGGKHGPALNASGVALYCLRMPRGRPTLSGMWKLFSLIRRERPHVVQTWMYHADLIGGMIARAARVDAVCWGVRTSNINPREMKYATFLVIRQCARLSSLVPRRIISCSHEAVEQHTAAGYATDRFVVIPNGCDLQRFRPDPHARERLRRQWQTPPGQHVIGMVARFDPHKDHRNLIVAMGILRKRGHCITWILAGSGIDHQNDELVHLLRSNGVFNDVRLLGPQNDIPGLMNALDLHVLSSCGEAFPNVLAEAMACGIPCIATDVGDARSIIGSTGWLVPPRDSNALAHAIESAFIRRNAADWAARGDAARTRIRENFGLDRMCDGYKRTWSAIAASMP